MKKNNIKLIIVIILLLEGAYLLGLWGIVDSKPKLVETSLSLVYFLALENLLVQIPTEYSNMKVVTAQFISHITLYLAVVLALFKEVLASIRRTFLTWSEHSLIIGLGENNRTYLISEEASKNHGKIIIIESDPDNIHIEQFRDKGFGVFIGTLDEYKVKFKHLCRVVISTGNDRQNIEIVGKLIGMIPVEMTKKSFGCPTVIHVHFQNQDYKALLQQEIVNGRKNLPLEFKPYSFNDDAAREVFEKHTILGNYHELAKTNKPYSVVVVGNGDLAERIIYHLYMISNLPNKNILTIHCICEDAPAFLSRIRSRFTGINKISSIRLRGHSLPMDTPDFFRSDVWKQHNLNKVITNVYVCHDDENINLECAVNLYEKVYLEDAVKKEMKTKVHFAMYHDLELGSTINGNKEEFKEFYTFGNADEICGRDHFIDETHENIAKLIHKGYGEVYSATKIVDLKDDRVRNEIDDKWYDTTKFTDRESNRSQALHINTKLMSMGLKKVKVYEIDELDKDKSGALLKKNIEIFKERSSNSEEELIKLSNNFEEELIKLSSQLPKSYDGCKFDENLIKTWYEKLMKNESMIAKLMKAEHERWNAYHYLNGWSYSKKKNKDIKKHNCLTPLDNFDDVWRQMTIIYDLYSVIYIPSYLASTGYKIEKIGYEEKLVKKNLDVAREGNISQLIAKISTWLRKEEFISIGITGHRNTNMDDNELTKILKNEMAKVFGKYKEVLLASPLAEGADRLFIQEAVKINSDKIKSLHIMMPFDKDEYMKDFKTESSKKVFEDLYALNKKYENIEVKKYVIYPVTVKDKNRSEKIDRNGCYLNTGKWIVDKSDILFAIWDGEKSNGKGGSAEIVDYAISKRKKIIWINPNTYELMTASYPYSCNNGDK